MSYGTFFMIMISMCLLPLIVTLIQLWWKDFHEQIKRKQVCKEYQKRMKIENELYRQRKEAEHERLMTMSESDLLELIHKTAILVDHNRGRTCRLHYADYLQYREIARARNMDELVEDLLDKESEVSE